LEDLKSELLDLVGFTPPKAFREEVVVNLDKQIDLQILNSLVHSKHTIWVQENLCIKVDYTKWPFGKIKNTLA
jgi:hypothetical protein